MAKIKMVHVPYKSTGAAMADILSGQAPIIIGSLLPVIPQLKAGKLRALGVTTEKRWHTLPDVPTISETLPGYDVTLWFGTMAPRGIPQAVLDRLNGAINDALAQPDVKKRLADDGMIATGGGTPRSSSGRGRNGGSGSCRAACCCLRRPRRMTYGRRRIGCRSGSTSTPRRRAGT